MSYAIRNTIILLVALLVIYGSGYAYMHFFQKTVIEELEQNIQTRQAEYDEKSTIASYVPGLREQFSAAENFVNNYEKTIFAGDQPDEVFRFLTLINTGPNLDFDFTYQDSTVTDDYGIIQTGVVGSGGYRGFLTFINRIENSDPVQKINNISISPINDPARYGQVNFEFRLDSYYDRLGYFDTDRTPGIASRSVQSLHNPFFPLIRDLEPNVDDLINVEASRLVGVGNSRIYMLNQEGTMVTLQAGDRVYLGRLESINVQQGNAVFRLNKGGIIELITLEVER